MRGRTTTQEAATTARPITRPVACGRLISDYPQPELITRVGAAGRTAGETDHGRNVGLDGTEADWIVVAAHG